MHKKKSVLRLFFYLKLSLPRDQTPFARAFTSIFETGYKEVYGISSRLVNLPVFLSIGIQANTGKNWKAVIFSILVCGLLKIPKITTCSLVYISIEEVKQNSCRSAENI